VWFVAASVLCAAAPTTEVLVAARALQGIGGALLTPGSLAILQASFHPDDRARAIGAWSGLGGVTTAVGPFLGGWLVDAASWRWIFLLNVPLGAVVLYVAAVHLPESRDGAASDRLDVWGAVLGASGLAVTTYGLIDGDLVIGLTGAAVLVAFVLTEWRTPHPTLPLGVFRSRQFSATNAVTFFLYGALGASLFLIGLTLQEALGYAPLEAGVATLPITAMMLLFSARSGALARRIGPRVPMSVGPAIMAGGLVLMTRIEPGATYVGAVLPALLVLSSGLALTVAPLTATALASADPQHAGVASGVNNAVARTGGLVAVAVVPLIAGFRSAGAVAPTALVTGFHRVSVAAAVAMGIGAVLSWAFVRDDVLVEGPGGEVEPGGEPAGEPARCTYHCAADAPPLAVDECPDARHPVGFSPSVGAEP
jgi:EmrB/QacA subfamily drug resistance transporter